MEDEKTYDLSSIANARQERPQRIIILGRPKSGKSTFAAGFDSPVFLPIIREEGIDSINVQSFPVSETFADVMGWLRTLCNNDHSYKTVIIDSASAFQQLAWDECCRRNDGVDSIEKVGGGFSKGYTECLVEWIKIISALDYLRETFNIQPVIIGHTKMEKYNDPLCEPYTRYIFDVNKYANELLTRWADGVLFIQRKTLVIHEDIGFDKTHDRAIDADDNDPYLYTHGRAAHPGGGRGEWRYLPYELPLNYGAFDSAMKTAKAKYDSLEKE